MTFKNFLVALALTGLFLGILLVAGTVQNHGCLPWKEAIHIGGSTFSEGDTGDWVCR